MDGHSRSAAVSHYVIWTREIRCEDNDQYDFEKWRQEGLGMTKYDSLIICNRFEGGFQEIIGENEKIETEVSTKGVMLSK